MSRWRTPNGFKASTTALTTAGVEPMVAASPMPFAPSGLNGEGATIGSTPAVVNAVVDALKPFGVRHLDMPLRPERVWRAMQQGSKK